jgi:uncharacterized protein
VRGAMSSRSDARLQGKATTLLRGAAMTNRPVAPTGAPCWVDLWTSDVEGSRHFYSELFGWQAGEPSSDHGGYFMFTRAGTPVAGAMGGMGDTPADDTWKPFFASPAFRT